MREDPRISVAIPLYDEAENVPELLRRVHAVLETQPNGPHEIVLIDDGSADDTFESVINQPRGKNSEIVCVRLSRNFGHQAALTAALDHLSGDVAVLMDGDLQDAPEWIPRFLERYHEGYDVIYARRASRQAPWWLKICYFVYYRMLSVLANLTLPVDSGDFALMSIEVVNAIRSSPEHHRYLRGLRTWAGFRQTGIDVDRPARVRGHSKYGFFGLLRLAFDGIFSFSELPLRFASAIGGLTILGALLYALFALIAKLFFDASPQGFTTIILVVLFVSGVQMLFLGIIGEYVGRIYNEVKGRPQYIIGSVHRADEATR